MKTIYCIILILLPFSLFAQYEVDGIGFIDLKINDRNKMYELDLYALPEGEITVCLKRGNRSEYFRTIIIDNQNDRKIVKRKNTSIVVIGWGRYYGQLLQYYEEKDGFAKVRINQKYYWINLDQLAIASGELVSWNTYFTNIDHNQMRVLYTMNLRTAPTANSDKIMVVRRIEEGRSFHLAKMTGRFEGKWAEVNIHVWENSDYCKNRNNSDRIIKGWMKYLDDKGFPNVLPVDFSCD